MSRPPSFAYRGLLWWSCSWESWLEAGVFLWKAYTFYLGDQSSERQNEGKTSLSFFHYFKQAAAPTFNHSVCSMYRISMVKVGHRKLRKSLTLTEAGFSSLSLAQVQIWSRDPFTIFRKGRNTFRRGLPTPINIFQTWMTHQVNNFGYLDLL